jgi:penicillin-binding protein 1A
LCGAVLVVAGVAVYVASVVSGTPSISSLTPHEAGQSSIVYAGDNSVLGYARSSEFRVPVSSQAVSPNIKNATVAIEDEHFYQHGGVDFSGIVRAMLADLTSGKTVQGGSTITQQLVRALYIPTAERTIDRKIREAKLAHDLEAHQSKDWILNSYLNVVPYGTNNGRTATGVEAASEIYFSKHANDLTLDQAALLAGLPQAPSTYNPFRDPDAAMARRNDVLGRMAKDKMISPSEAAQASAAPLGLKPSPDIDRQREPYFFDYVQDQMIDRYGVAAYRTGGLKIYTTIDPRLQDDARRAIHNQLSEPGDPASALVSIDPATGGIKAMASSTDHASHPFNLAVQGHRQPGSTFKAMVLATAIRQGIDPNATFYTSKPLDLDLPGYGHFHVDTFDRHYAGRENVTKATLTSDNTVFAQLDLDVGPQEVANTAKAMGITSKLEGLPAEGLGGLREGVTPLELADAYATLAAGGVHRAPEAIAKVVFPDGHVDDPGAPAQTRAFSDGVASAVTQILQQDLQSGTAKDANYGCPAAGKTGTTDDYKDAWFAGYTPSLATSVWVGYPATAQPMQDVHGMQVTGGTIPADITRDYMQRARGQNCEPFPPPTEPAQLSPFKGHYTAPEPPPPPPPVPQPEPPPDQPLPPPGYDPRFYETPPQAVPPPPGHNKQ